MHWEAHEFELPVMEHMDWEVILSTSEKETIGKKVGQSLEMEARSIMVLKSVPEEKKIEPEIEEIVEDAELQIEEQEELELCETIA